MFAGAHPVRDRPGALYGVLEPLARRGISMNRIESRPEHGHKWQYAFFIDVAGHCEESPLKDALAEVGPGQHFLGCSHTHANFKNAFYRSTIADNNSYEQWVEDGSQDAEQRAEKLYKEMLASYTAPELDPDVDAVSYTHLTLPTSDLV